MKENGSMMKLKEWEHIFIVMEHRILVNGEMIGNMEKVLKHGLMVQNTNENIMMVKNIIKEFYIFQMDQPNGEFHFYDINGKGLYIWPNQRKYEVTGIQYKMQGHGRITWDDGRMYEGEFENDKKHGKEYIFIWTDGRKYIGQWKDGKQHGRGHPK